MATGNHTADPSRSTDTFMKIFNKAKTDYENRTGERLEHHPFAQRLASCQGPEAISAIFESQSGALNRLSKDKMTNWCRTIVDVLLTFSDTLGDVAGLVSHLLRPVPSSNSRTSGSQTFSPAKLVLTGFGILLQVRPRTIYFIAHICNAQTHTGRQRRLSH